MSDQQNLQPRLREQANEILRRQLWTAERQELLTRCWTHHDVQWYMAVSREFGVEVANRLNHIATHEIGKAEAHQVVRALGLSAPTGMDDYLVVQEMLISLLEPELFDYRVTKTADDQYQVHVQRCSARESAVHAGIVKDCACSICPRLTGWLDACGLTCRSASVPGKCGEANGDGCMHTITVEQRSPFTK
jgi:hypothetical protein